jgi:hypothetical protein
LSMDAVGVESWLTRCEEFILRREMFDSKVNTDEKLWV